MSDYYDLFLAVDLEPDLSEAAVREPRWLVGQAEAPPVPESADRETWGHPWPVFAGGTASHSFDGADTSVLLRAVARPGPAGRAPWSLTVRVCIHEDDFGILMEVVEWVLRRATTRGRAGFLRDSALEDVRYVVRHENGFELVNTRTVRGGTRAVWS
ncbi:hypothetical protein [Streptomyces sp. NRRL B-24484]|uniref:hypothetical protein n=1 Tax=Streptomyces sp. NRRL B-24484 TaxID=1463833 RepID=UPI0004C018FB|nr:hypothetical protein [Streptomyces sp. NRRL B-24484]